MPNDIERTHPSCSAGPSTFFAGWPIFSAIPWMLLCAKCVRAEEEKMVIGVQPVRARCGYRLCLTQRQATHPNVAVLLKGDFE